MRAVLLAASLLAILGFGPAHAGEDLFLEHCASCHGADRLGGQGPALLPETLRRVSRERAAKAIAEGLPSTQMPAFGEVLDEISDFYAKQLRDAIKAVTGMIEPIMIIIMGSIVGFIAMAIILPIFKMSQIVR